MSLRRTTRHPLEAVQALRRRPMQALTRLPLQALTRCHHYPSCKRFHPVQSMTTRRRRQDDDGGGGDKAAETKHDKALMTTSMEIAGMAANDKKTGAEVRMKCKFIPDPNNAAEVRLRSMLDKHNEREARRKARKRAAADV